MEAGEFLKKEPNASRYRFRLMAFPGSGKAEVGPDGEVLPAKPPHAKNPDFQLSEGTLPAYLSTARRIFELRNLCESNASFEEALELIYEGTRIPWSKVCFERGEFIDAYTAAKEADGKTHPMALIGTVRSMREAVWGGTTYYVLAMEPYRSKRSPDRVVNCVEPQVKTTHKFYFNDISVGDVVIAFGHWRPSQGKDGNKDGTTFKNHRLHLTPRRKDQIAKAPREPEGAE